MSPAPTQNIESREKMIFPALDLLRFSAALMVLLYHLRTRHWAAWAEMDPGDQNLITAAILGAMRFGGAAVLVFFCLSGYLVGGLVLQRWRAGKFRAQAYGIDRFTRIYLPLLPAVGLAWVCAALSGHQQSGLVQYLGNILSLQEIWVATLHENPPLWSISYEVWLYILAGGLALSFSRRGEGAGRTRVPGLIILGVALICCVRLNVFFLSCWLAGALAHRFRDYLATPRAGLPGLLAAAGAAVLYETASGALFDFATVLLALGCSAALPWLASLRVPDALARCGHFLAGFSYSLYLTHYPLMMLWYEWFPKHGNRMSISSLISYGMVVVIMMASAWVYHLLFEKPVGTVRLKLKALFSPG